MITFNKIYECIFSSFRIDGASQFLHELEQEKIKNLIIIKRSWIFGLFMSLVFLFILALMGVNIYYISIDYASVPLVLGALLVVLMINVFLGIYSSISYIQHFRELHAHGSTLTGIQSIEEIQVALQKEDRSFTTFFNQITLSYYLFIIITLFNIYYLIFLRESPLSLSTFSGNFFLIIQIVLIAYYRRYMIDLEMDYIIVVPNRVYFIDQIGVYKRTQSIKWVNNIRIIQSSYPNPLGSLFNYGTIEIIIKSDTPAIVNTYHMRYVDNPIEIENAINKLIENTSSS